jgi:hypothetical protein
LSQLSFARCHVARWALALGAVAVLLPQGARGETQQLTVAVVAQGSLPGVKDADLNRFLADTMNAGVEGPWRFDPSPPGAAPAPNRIEWSIKSMASAEGTVRNFGFARAAIDRMMGAHQFLSIEVTLYLGGQYQTASHSEVTATKEAQNPELVSDVVRSTRQLIAYEAMDTTKPPIPQ